MGPRLHDSGILPRKGQLSPKTPVPCHNGILQKYVHDGVASSSRRTPLDFQSKEMAKIEKCGISVRRGTITESEAVNYLSRYTNETIDLWQSKAVTSDMGRELKSDFLTSKLGLSVTDHYTSQLISCHEYLKKSLYRFNLRGDVACRCGSPTESVEHLPFECYQADHERLQLIIAVQEHWPCNPEFNSNPKSCSGLFESLLTQLWIFLMGGKLTRY